MRRKNNNDIFFFAGVIVVIIIIIAMIVMPGSKNDTTADNNLPEESNIAPILLVSDTNRPVMTGSPTQVDPDPVVTQPKIILSDVISAADAWMPCTEHEAWIGKMAPDFTITDIDGNEHALSSYRGKSVIVNLWAPWFAPTHKELDTLIQLKRAVGSDKLVILGISFDSDVTVKRYVNKQTAINFPIVSAAQTLPAPYSTGKPLPCSMFITPEGTLKLSTRGSIPLDDYQALLVAE